MYLISKNLKPFSLVNYPTAVKNVKMYANNNNINNSNNNNNNNKKV